ncbi:hypothetical protein WH47_04685 [Habropoda laboriosa]|uniref:Uncharacterized protein n=1 Tax=Habropoda laboriosa TaxID=597456 RepID=A0A0L7R2J0_9HYME|nr:hypothetical protein WH47_04685 [Habropoda laboriosa]
MAQQQHTCEKKVKKEPRFEENFFLHGETFDLNSNKYKSETIDERRTENNVNGSLPWKGDQDSTRKDVRAR